MSRCFPFPPPGYVKKTKADATDLLKKEKHKEKKHRKEKKESKEKREKDRSDGKKRDKKDKNDKHKEKKDRDKDKDKNRISDEKRPPGLGQSESHHNGENLPDEIFFSRKPDHSGEKFIGREKEKDSDRISISVGKKVGGQFPGSHGEKLPLGQFPSFHGEKLPSAPISKDSKFVQDLARRSRDEGRAATNHFTEKFTAPDQKGGEGVFRLVAKTSGTWTEGKEKSKDRRVDDRKPEDGTKSKNAMARNLPGMFQNKAEEIPKPLDRNVDMQIKGKALKTETWQKKGDDNKLRENNKEKKNHEKNKDIVDKPKKEIVKDRSGLKNADLDKFKEVGMVDHMDFVKPKTSELPKDSEKSTVPEKNLKKRKDHETNGFLHANDSKPNKLPRLVSSSDRSTQNGRTMELNHISTTCTPDKQGTVNYIVPYNKDHKLNGIIEATQPRHAPSPTKPSLKAVQADQITELTIKPPHPDLKYLNEILTVPKLEVSPDFDDQEWWLPQRSESQSKQPERRDPPEVWAEARWIESGDVYALPYVFPY